MLGFAANGFGFSGIEPCKVDFVTKVRVTVRVRGTVVKVRIF